MQPFTKHFIRQITFIAIAVVVFVIGILIIRAAANRGSSPYIYIKV